MQSVALVERVARLFDTRWRPRLNLTTSERDNIVRWEFFTSAGRGSSK